MAKKVRNKKITASFRAAMKLMKQLVSAKAKMTGRMLAVAHEMEGKMFRATGQIKRTPLKKKPVRSRRKNTSD